MSNDDLTEEEIAENIEVLKGYEHKAHMMVFDLAEDVMDARNMWNTYQEHKASGENPMCFYCICAEDILKDYPDIDSVQLRKIFVSRLLLGHYDGSGSKSYNPFSEARIAGLVDDDTPKLTLQTAKEIIAQYGDDFGKVLEEFESVQPYPDEDVNYWPQYAKNSGWIPTLFGQCYKEYDSRNPDGTLDSIFVINRFAVVHNQYDADNNCIVCELLLLTDEYDWVYYVPFTKDDYNGLYVYRHPEEFS